MLSTTLGRPAMIVSAARDPMPLPLTVNEEGFQSGTNHELNGDIQEAYPPSLITFFVLSAELFETVEEFSTFFHTSDLSLRPTHLADFFIGTKSVLSFDERMINWNDNVPRHLQFDHARSSPPESNGQRGRSYRQAVILRIRYLSPKHRRQPQIIRLT